MEDKTMRTFGYSAKCGTYVVTATGQVYTIKDGQWKKVKLYTSNRGYLRFSYKGKWLAVHRVVYETFIGKIPQGLVIDHKDENKTNNSIYNLQLLTIGDNVRKHWALVKEGRI